MDKQPFIELTWCDQNGRRVEGFGWKEELLAAQSALAPSFGGSSIITSIKPAGLEKTPEAIAAAQEAAETVEIYYGPEEQYRRDGHFSCIIVPVTAQGAAEYRKEYGGHCSGYAYH